MSIEPGRLLEARALKNDIDAAMEHPYPTARTFESLATRAKEVLAQVVSGAFRDDQQLRDSGSSFVFLCSKTTDLLRLLYERGAYDYPHRDLWNALDDVRRRFDPESDGLRPH